MTKAPETSAVPWDVDERLAEPAGNRALIPDTQKRLFPMNIPEKFGAFPRLFLVVAVAAATVLLPVPAIATEHAMRVDTEDPRSTSQPNGVTSSGVSPVIQRAGLDPFLMIGATWAGAPADQTRIRVHGPDGWRPWTVLESDDDEGPDPTSAEGAGQRTLTRPIWVGNADGYEIESTSPDLRLHLVRADRARVRLRSGTPEAKAAHTPVIRGRGEWGARPPKTPNSVASQLKMSFVHHTAGPNNYSSGDVPRVIQGMQAYHMDANGWDDLGYNFVVDRFGRIWEGRAGGIEAAVIGAHTQGFNTASTGVAVMGTFTSVAPSPEAVNGVTRLLAWKLGKELVDPQGRATMRSYGNDRYPNGATATFNTIAGHRDAKSTSCPGQLLFDRLPEIRRNAHAIATSSPDSPLSPAFQLALSNEAASRVSGDFNADGVEDVGFFYNYGGGNTGLWTFNGPGLNVPTARWFSCAGCTSWENMKPVVGDFNGDGTDDIGFFYNYGGGNTALWTFNGPGLNVPTARWFSCAGCTSWEYMKPVAGDFTGDGADDVGFFYNYGGGNTGLWTLNGPGLNAPVPKWYSCAGCTAWERLKPVTGDFTGDGADDVGFFYNYGGGNTALWTLNGPGLNAPVPKWFSCAGCTSWENMKPLAGDFTGGGTDDVGFFYNYGGGNTGLWTLNGPGLNAPVPKWYSCAGCTAWDRTKVT
ncbi:MAG: N-acetylmuramoyl-L-alanine amidase [Actinomycetota bacterium]|nr:N-acetylmuramoyl-L-alanine amidase [Actinomycetota bacterium]